jgi:cytochrome c peroxidase
MLGASPERGAALFVGKAACTQCHSGPRFTDDQFHNIGVPQLGTYVPVTTDCPSGGYCDCVSDDTNVPTQCFPIGARDGLRRLVANRFRRDSVWSDDATCMSHYSDHYDPSYATSNPDECDGRVKWYSLGILADSQRGAWKTPSLRDLTLTAPYMHNGMYSSLAEVVDHYNKGGIIMAGGETNGTIDPKVKVLDLTTQEQADLVAFLMTLTGTVDPAVVAPPTVPADSPF